MKRIFFIISILLTAASLKAQYPLPMGSMNGFQPGFRSFNQQIDTAPLQKKWFLTKQVGFSTGLLAFNGRNSGFLSTPLTVQLNRQLTNNVLAFAGVSVAPSYFPYFNAPFQSNFNKFGNFNNFMTPNSFGTYSTAQMGLMYINNERTFSISGSIGVGRTDFYNRSQRFTPGRHPDIRDYKK